MNYGENFREVYYVKGKTCFLLSYDLIIVVVLFGTKKLRNVGADLGSAIKSFKKSSRESGTDSPVSKKESSKEEN